MDQIKIGKFIAELRKEQNLTQLDLATQLGVTDRAVSKWENGRGLPDISLIQPLCETLDISINELLNGERISAAQTLEIANQNIIGMLSDRKDESKKQKRAKIVCAVFAIIAAILTVITGMTFSSNIIAEITGDGYSFSAAAYTKKAERVVKYIADGDYEKASKLMGFYTDDRNTAEKEWIYKMKEMSEQIQIEEIISYDMVEDDEFVSGYVIITAYDSKSRKRFVFKVLTCAQKGGIAFGGLTSIVETNETREDEVGKIIYDALDTWYAG